MLRAYTGLDSQGGQARTFHQHHIRCRVKEKSLVSVLLNEKLKPSIAEEQYYVFQNTFSSYYMVTHQHWQFSFLDFPVTIG